MGVIENELKFPRSVWFIICEELCERINYSGIKTVLVLYLTSVLNFSEDDSTVIFHCFIFLSYFMPLIGAILADSYWGKFKTMIRMSIFYLFGNLILTGASMANNFSIHTQRCIAIIALLLIAIGTGGIKPCTYTFGGDQFKLPEQRDQLTRFFKRFVAAISLGALIATFFIPELRKGVHCLGRDTCFPLAFGVLSLVMITATVVFLLGSNLYIKRKPENHVIFRTFGCIFYAIRKKCTSPVSDCAHWLDHAGKKYSQIQISDTKSALEVIHIFIAFPAFWALYGQLGSRWIFQATLMNGKIECIDWEIKPDQMQTIHPLTSLLLILSYNSILSPFLAKFGIRRPIQKLILGCSLAAVAFLLTAVLQYKIFGENAVIPASESQFTVYNGLNCNVQINSSLAGNGTIGSTGYFNFKYKPILNEEIVDIRLTFDSSCKPNTNYGKLDTNVTVAKGKKISYFLTPTLNNEVLLRRINDYDDLRKPKNGYPSLRFIISDDIKKNESFALVINEKKSLLSYNMSSFANEHFKQVKLGNYNLTHGEEVISSNIHFIPATIYTLILNNNSLTMESSLYTTNSGNYLHIFWQLPQYAFIILSDVIFIATAIEFTFTEAPPRIKSFISACYSITQSFGNLLVVFISVLSFKEQMHEYLFFSGLMFADTLLLAYLGYNYKYKAYKQRPNDDAENNENDTKLKANNNEFKQSDSA
ncbi:Proton-dependent oligopeptide transporter family,Major facilitator superfamily domain [Cinara cedri]|uniref:Proton-dependent oligopeptide transporter family,Major facilitator superfamily domain n=1 Tax=Cinara cedri TaxID=506608 RepID=A0A5E4MPP7_9HEMI|nr:Proton-dependent oligopeptide transporter family,Major facilitator superfamily domain [Cinara cedri]